MAPSVVEAQEVGITAAAIHPKDNSQVPDGFTQTPLDASKLVYTYTQNTRPVPDDGSALACDHTVATDHMILVPWKQSTGWAAPQLKPYGPISLMPTASVFHYATECFEGLKVYCGYDGSYGSSGQMAIPSSGMRLRSSPEDMVRAWVGGFGHAKVGANYGPSLPAASDAQTRGYHQILWLYGPQGECTEAGASNFFIVWKRKEDAKTELITAPLDDKLILDGVTRRSCLDLARERLSDIELTERKYTIDEVLEAHAEGRILEAFVAGTAFFICSVSQIHHRGKDINIPVGQDGVAGEVTGKLKGWLEDIMYGRVEHKWAVVIPEKL